MKGLMDKLKGLPFKRLLLEHGEKFGFACVLLIVIMALSSTQWTGYDKTPLELTEKATKGEQLLLSTPWPEEKQAAFVPSTYDTVATTLRAPLDRTGLSYTQPLSFRLYAKREPNKEPERTTVQYLIADAGKAPLGIIDPEAGAEDPSMTGAGGVSSLPAGPMGPRSPMGPSAGPAGGHSPMGLPMGEGEIYGGNSMAASGIKVRGQRFVALRGVFNLYEQSIKFQKALHIETRADALAYIELLDIKIQRQKAIPGAKPWDGPWEDVNLERVDELLQESSSFEIEPHNVSLISDVMTMPIPARLDGEWNNELNRRYITHPLLENFQLSPEQRELEKKINAAAMDFMAEQGASLETGGKRRGFAGHQVDARGLREGIMGDSNMMGEVMNRAGIRQTRGGAGGPGASMPMMAPAGAGHSGGGGGGRSIPPQMRQPGMPSPTSAMQQMMGAGGRGRPGAMPMAMPMMGAPGAAGMAGMMGQNSVANLLGAAAEGHLLLFRFFDFEVNPGEAYRYRVKVVLYNPNFEAPLETVVDASVTESEELETDWSVPSAPTAVAFDTDVFLTTVDQRGSRNSARMSLVQWDPALGTYLQGDMFVEPGQFVSGLVDKVEVIDLSEQVKEERKINIASPDLLLDIDGNPQLIPQEHPDLKIASRSPARPTAVELPDLALLVDQYGQIQMIDQFTSQTRQQSAKKQLDEYNKAFDYLNEPEASGTGLDAVLGVGAGPGGSGSMNEMMRSMQGNSNPLRKSRRGAGGMAGPGMMPMGPGGAAAGHSSEGGSKTKKKTGRPMAY